MAVAAVTITAALPAAAEGLEGSHRVLHNALGLDVSGGTTAIVQVTSGACMGYLEGPVTGLGDGRREIQGSSVEAPCTLSVLRRDDGALEMSEGPGCGYHHGASCEFSGVLGPAR